MEMRLHRNRVLSQHCTESHPAYTESHPSITSSPSGCTDSTHLFGPRLSSASQSRWVNRLPSSSHPAEAGETVEHLPRSFLPQLEDVFH
jgi:hypothetical protein